LAGEVLVGLKMSKVFISHAGEDKETVAIPLAQLLKQRGIEVWHERDPRSRAAGHFYTCEV
jgi:hypothetical protein